MFGIVVEANAVAVATMQVIAIPAVVNAWYFALNPFDSSENKSK